MWEIEEKINIMADIHKNKDLTIEEVFKLAIEKQVPIVPVTFLDNFRLFLNDGKHRARPGQSNVIVHAPIVTTGMTKKDLPALAEQVKQTIQTALDNKYESR